jgi:hypothetical protein
MFDRIFESRVESQETEPVEHPVLLVEPTRNTVSVEFTPYTTNKHALEYLRRNGADIAEGAFIVDPQLNENEVTALKEIYKIEDDSVPFVLNKLVEAALSASQQQNSPELDVDVDLAQDDSPAH